MEKKQHAQRARSVYHRSEGGKAGGSRPLRSPVFLATDNIIAELHAVSDESHLTGMGHFGIKTERALGVSVVNLRSMARRIGKNHVLALELWETDLHEARILATMIDDPLAVTEEQMEQWVTQFDSWDICDQCCGNLFDKTALAWDKAVEWCAREQEYEKRAGFALIAYLAVHDKTTPDERFLPLLAIIKREAGDTRNFVKKAINWALREIGKRNAALNQASIATAQAIRAQSKRGHWIASDALRELTSEKVQVRLRRSEQI